RLRRRSTVGWRSMDGFLSIVVITATDVGVEKGRRCGKRRWRLLVFAVLEDLGDGGVGERVEHQSPRASGVDPLGHIAFDQRENADRRSKALFGMRPRTKDDIDQDGSVGTEFGGLTADTFMGPIA